MIADFYGIKGFVRLFWIHFFFLACSLFLFIVLGGSYTRFSPEWSNLIITTPIWLNCLGVILVPIAGIVVRSRKLAKRRPEARIFRYVTQTAETLDAIIKAGGETPRNQQLSNLCLAIGDGVIVFAADWGDEILELHVDEVREIRVESTGTLLRASSEWPAIVIDIADGDRTISIPFFLTETLNLLALPTHKQLLALVAEIRTRLFA